MAVNNPKIVRRETRLLKLLQMSLRSRARRAISRALTVAVVVIVIIIVVAGGYYAVTLNSHNTTSTPTTSGTTSAGSGTTTSSSVGSATTSSSSGGQLIIGLTTPPAVTDLNPAKMITTYYIAETYASLVGWDSNGNYVPMLAQSWSISPDGRNFTFNLKPNLEWSDGQPITSADVAFTFQLVAEQSPLWYYLDSPIEVANSSTLTGFSIAPGAITTPNATTIIFHSSTPSAPLFIYLGGQPVYPQHYYASQNLTANNPNLSTMVGSGPFIPTSYTPDTELDMVPNPHYFGGAPKLNKVIFKYFSTTTSAEIALESGEINFINGIPATDVSALGKVSGITLGTEEDQSNIYVVFNMNPSLTNGGANPVSNILVRKAIAMALNIPAILNASFGSSQYYRLANQIEVPNMYYGGQSVQNTSIPSPEYSYNVTGAEDLLNQAGYTNNSNGYRFTLNIVTPSGGIGSAGTGPTIEMLQLMTSQLAQVGITLTITADDSTTFDNAVYSAAPPKAWNLALSVISESPDADVAPFYMLSSLGGNAGAGGFNSGGFNSTYFNNLVLLEENTTNTNQRIAVVQQIDGYAHDQLPVLELYYQIEIEAWSNNVHGFTLGLGNPWHDYYGSFKCQSLDNITIS
jgi:peptide/nickel transport system substrate-binding protein